MSAISADIKSGPFSALEAPRKYLVSISPIVVDAEYTSLAFLLQFITSPNKRWRAETRMPA